MRSYTIMYFTGFSKFAKNVKLQTADGKINMDGDGKKLLRIAIVDLGNSTEGKAYENIQTL